MADIVDKLVAKHTCTYNKNGNSRRCCAVVTDAINKELPTPTPKSPTQSG
jgi:hypothetical protein